MNCGLLIAKISQTKRATVSHPVTHGSLWQCLLGGCWSTMCLGMPSCTSILWHHADGSFTCSITPMANWLHRYQGPSCLSCLCKRVPYGHWQATASIDFATASAIPLYLFIGTVTSGLHARHISLSQRPTNSITLYNEKIHQFVVESTKKTLGFYPNVVMVCKLF